MLLWPWLDTVCHCRFMMWSCSWLCCFLNYNNLCNITPWAVDDSHRDLHVEASHIFQIIPPHPQWIGQYKNLKILLALPLEGSWMLVPHPVWKKCHIGQCELWEGYSKEKKKTRQDLSSLEVLFLDNLLVLAFGYSQILMFPKLRDPTTWWEGPSQ